MRTLSPTSRSWDLGCGTKAMRLITGQNDGRDGADFWLISLSTWNCIVSPTWAYHCRSVGIVERPVVDVQASRT